MVSTQKCSPAKENKSRTELTEATWAAQEQLRCGHPKWKMAEEAAAPGWPANK